MNRHTLAVVLCLSGATGFAFAAEEKKAGMQDAKSAAEEAWVKQVAQGGLAEVELGKLAQQKAQSDAVKQYAQHMIEDHTKSNEELMKVAAQKGITPPSQPAPKHMATKKELMETSGADFDKKYIEIQIKDHQEMIGLFEQGAKRNSGPLKDYASKTLPNLKEHLKMAQDVQSKSGPPAQKQTEREKK